MIVAASQTTTRSRLGGGGEPGVVVLVVVLADVVVVVAGSTDDVDVPGTDVDVAGTTEDVDTPGWVVVVVGASGVPGRAREWEPAPILATGPSTALTAVAAVASAGATGPSWPSGLPRRWSGACGPPRPRNDEDEGLVEGQVTTAGHTRTLTLTWMSRRQGTKPSGGLGRRCRSSGGGAWTWPGPRSGGCARG